jgi:hypothetical protein
MLSYKVGLTLRLLLAVAVWLQRGYVRSMLRYCCMSEAPQGAMVHLYSFFGVSQWHLAETVGIQWAETLQWEPVEVVAARAKKCHAYVA